MSEKEKTLREIATELNGGMQCNCDLDNWQPNVSTGHSDVCRVHKRAMQIKYQPHDVRRSK